MRKYLRNIIFLVTSVILYLLWYNGGEKVYAEVLTFGIDKITTRFSGMEEASLQYIEEQDKTMIFFLYPDRSNRIGIEYCLPIVLLLAWHIGLFFDQRLKAKSALKLFGTNFSIIYILQIFFPLLLFNISQSKVKSTGLFIGLQIFVFLVFFLIIKDSLIIKYKYGTKEKKQ
jgi:hypothetical protein